MFQIIKFTVLFNIVTGVKYNPETFNIALPSGIKYHVTKDKSSCPEKAQRGQTISFRYTVVLIDGENVRHIHSDRKIDEHAVTMVLGSNEVEVPKGKDN